jgi:hypothetical protein
MEKGPFTLRFGSHPGMTETSPVPEPSGNAGITCDEFVVWMVVDASLGRCDRWGPKLI